MAMGIDKFIIGTLVFMVFIIGGVLYVHDIETSYSDENISMGIDEYVNDTYLTLTDTTAAVNVKTKQLSNTSYDQSKNVQGRMLDKQIDDTDTESSMFAGAFSVFRLIPTSINLVNNVMNQVANQMGIPAIFISIGFSALVIIVILSIVFLIFRVRS